MKKRNHIFIYGLVSFIVLLLSATLIYRAYSFYEENNFFDLIHGEVPNQNFDIFVSYYEDNNGEETLLSSMPEGREYQVEIVCNQGGSGYWNYEEWTAVIQAQKPRTKCSIHFSPKQPTFIATIRSISSTNSGDGLYEITHPDTEFTDSFSGNLTSMQISNLKLKELRYAGKSPNNYVKFNDELWRVIGLVNTPEGERVKLVRDESIGSYSWDSSDVSINQGWGVNEWSQSKVMKLLNYGAYYHREKGICFQGQNNVSVSCDFQNTGLSSLARSMIDSVTWNTGSNGEHSYQTLSPKKFYNLERSNYVGKNCSDASLCNDTIIRTTTWVGRVGLMYPSDYGYATSGGSKIDREACLTNSLFLWNTEALLDCKENNWMFQEGFYQWSMMPALYSNRPYSIFYILGGGHVTLGDASGYPSIKPVIYLKENVRVLEGNGEKNNPYLLSL